MKSLCSHWEFTEHWQDAFALGEGAGISVRLPHTVKELPLHYADHTAYQMLCGYRRSLPWQEDWAGKRLFLQFDGAAHIATVYLNGREIAHHRTGYTGFRVEVTEQITRGENLLAVKLDTTENPQVPPFGFVIDYLTYGGLYREVWLDAREQDFIEDVFVTTPTLNTARVELTVCGSGQCRVSVEEEDGRVLGCVTGGCSLDVTVENARPWSVDRPCRYVLRCQLLREGRVTDTRLVKFGFRTVGFDENCFYLNGEKLFLRGLNRHQCYPYIGYAAPESLQREDARILKQELGCNAVRTSHYPQSHHFVDECDRLGLLVFMEIPGWQHVGDAAWQDQAVENTREMVLQYRNHPSIFCWGVRINESLDNDALYRRTNALAHTLDPTRPTTGVRYLEKSSLLEDVYSYNDFSHTGGNAGTKTKARVSPDEKKPLLISEHNGHMFPTKSFDTWQRRQEHALRHARVLNDAQLDGGHAGCFGWCMFDYPTHKDFGSGDRVCHHGVMDAFRNPKLAASFYASQQEETPVLAVGSSMDIGDYPGGILGDVYVFTNADTVAMYKNGDFVANLVYDDWGLVHGPLRVEDTVGCLLETWEGFPRAKAELLRRCLAAVAKRGLAGLRPSDLAKFAWAMVRYGLKFEDAVALYGKYVGNWGGEATVWRFDAIEADRVVASVTCCPSAKLHLEARVSSRLLREGETYDMAAVRVRILDENGNIAPYAQLPVEFRLEGSLELVGPAVATAAGGMTGLYVKTVAQTGSAKLTLSAPGLDAVTVDFTVE